MILVLPWRVRNSHNLVFIFFDLISSWHWQLHFMVELIVLVQTYLSPGQECLRSIVQQAIKNSRDDDNELISPLKVH